MSDTITLSKSALESMIAAAATQAAAAAVAAMPAQPKYVPSDYKIVYTDNIPSESGKKWASIEITHGGETVKLFVDRVHDAGERKDGADQTVIYASFPKERVKPAAKPAAAKPAAKRKPAAKAEVVDDIGW
jgi:hypothetical protein